MPKKNAVDVKKACTPNKTLQVDSIVSLRLSLWSHLYLMTGGLPSLFH